MVSNWYIGERDERRRRGNEDVKCVHVRMCLLEDPLAVHVVKSAHKLKHIRSHEVCVQVVPPPANQLVQVCIHEFKDQSQSPSRLIVQHLFKRNDVLVRRQSPQRLNLA